jgi:uncharacterized protein (TIGR00296 family)
MDFDKISIDDGVLLVQMARRAVTEYLSSNKKIINSEFDEKFSFNAGVFVTINDESGLRGCIGYPLAVKKLSNALIDAAISAATDDPRFSSVKQIDLKKLIFEITILSKTERIFADSTDEIINSIKIGRDGLIIEKGSQSGLLLPQVAIEYNWNAKQLLEQTCHKAGLPSDSWKDNTIEILKFQGLIFKETSSNGKIIQEKFQ